jgi:hypothetical protein
MFDKSHAVAGNFDLSKQVGVEEHGSAAIALGPNDVANQSAADGIKA